MTFGFQGKGHTDNRVVWLNLSEMLHDITLELVYAYKILVVKVMNLDHNLTKQIEEICAARGVRLTSQRKQVFELISASNKAASAYELLEALKKMSLRQSHQLFTGRSIFTGARVHSPG